MSLEKIPEDIKKEKAALEKVRQEQLRLYAAYKDLFGMPSAKIVLEDLRKRCYVDTPSYTPGVSNPSDTVHCEGKRAVYLHIKDMIKRHGQKLKEVVND